MNVNSIEYEELEPTPQRRSSDHWRIDKQVPIALILAVGLQTAGGIWWMAQLSTKLDNAVTTINEFKTERYTSNDARRDRLLIDQQFESAQGRDREIDRRINAIENRLDRVTAK